MAMDGLPEGVSPFGRVPEQLLQEAPILKRQRRRNREVLVKKGSVLGISTPRGKYRRRGVEGTHQEARRPLGAAQGGAAPGTLLVSGGAPLASLGYSGRFLHTDF